MFTMMAGIVLVTEKTGNPRACKPEKKN